MTRIFLIRHGETEWNKIGRLQGNSDVKLSPEGINQAKLLAERAPFKKVDAIYSSDLSRAFDTAKILSAKFNVMPVKTTNKLREMSFGDWEGKDLKEFTAQAPGNFEDFFIKPDKVHPPNGETFLECQARVMNALDEIIVEHENQSVIIVSHGAAIRLILCAALGMPIRKMWAIGQSNMALNILRVDDGNFTVELVNSTMHLYKF